MYHHKIKLKFTYVLNVSYKIKLSYVSQQDEIKFTNVLNVTYKIKFKFTYVLNVSQQDTNCVAEGNAKAKLSCVTIQDKIKIYLRTECNLQR